MRCVAAFASAVLLAAAAALPAAALDAVPMTVAPPSVVDGVLNSTEAVEPGRFEEAARKLFDRFDIDKNNVITQSDIDGFWTATEASANASAVLAAFYQKNKHVVEVINSRFVVFDANADNQVTWDEFWAEMSKHSSYFGASANGLTNKVACTIAHDVMDACKPELKNATAVTGNRMMFKLRVKLASGMCRAGLASFSEYKTETCVAAATSCEEAARCYADDEEEDDEEAEDAAEKPATLQRRSTRALQRLTKRDAAVWEVMYWVSMAILGVVSLGSIILFPFWVILLIVSLRTMDFKKLDQ